EISIGVDDDCVFAAHFEHGPLDPNLARNLVGGTLVNVETNFARAGEGDVPRLGMRHDRIAKARASSGTEVDYTVGDASLFYELDKLCCDGWRVARRFQNNGVACD